MTQHVVVWDDVETTEAPGGLTRRSLALPSMSLVTVTVPAGTQGTRHSHDHDQFVQVLSGAGELTTEQGTTTFSAGTTFVFPRGTWHIARFDSDTVLVESNATAD